MGKEITISSKDGSFMGYLATPAGGKGPGVVVVQDVFGLSDDIRQQADRLATAGYVAFAPDLYSSRGIRCVVAALVSSRTGKGQGYVEIAAARRFLAEQPGCNGRIGIIGFCMGGGFALMSAPSGEYAAASVNYGEVPADAQRVLAGSCPIVASYGGRDPMGAAPPRRLEEALTALDVPHDVKVYPDAGHSFMSTKPAAVAPLARLVRLDYKPESAEDSWRRIVAFFGEHLRSGPSAAT